MQTLPFLLALSVGFTHAFETDHLVAVGNIVTRRNNIRLALKDGVFWGLGHTSTILLVGAVFLLGKFALREGDFRYLEAGVGLMLITLGVVRLYRIANPSKPTHDPVVFPGHAHSHAPADHAHRLAYGVGLMHGLAGSGALILSVLTQIRGAGAGMAYLGLFGIGSIGGMMVAAGAFSIPFSARLTGDATVRAVLVGLSSALCIGVGMKVVYETLLAG